VSPTGATRRHKLPPPQNMVITSKRRFSFATEDDFKRTYKHKKFYVFQTVKSGKNKQTKIPTGIYAKNQKKK
jgi:hypothetical protein